MAARSLHHPDQEFDCAASTTHGDGAIFARLHEWISPVRKMAPMNQTPIAARNASAGLDARGMHLHLGGSGLWTAQAV